MRGVIFCAAVVLLCVCVHAVPKRRDPPVSYAAEQAWAYVTVRPKAHMFWWLYKSTHVDGWKERPLIMWLQGGPGASSTGYGNFQILGELNTDLNPRNSTWVKEANMLYVDNPVGAGYSYVEDDSAYTTDVDQIALDLLEVLKSFMNDQPEYKTIPFYIFGQSYGGKMAAGFAKRLHESIANGNIECNLKGFAMGNSWISPIDSTMTWAPLLLWMSAVDERGHNAIMDSARECKAAADRGDWNEATQLWRATQGQVNVHSNYIDFYNILNYRIVSQQSGLGDNDTAPWYEFLTNPGPYDLSDLMNGQVREYLKIIPENVIWGGQRGPVFQKQEGDFMKSVVPIVDELLQNTDMQVIVYQGQLDLICDTKGALDWVQQLKWENIPDFNSAPRTALVDPETKQTETFVKAYEQFKFYWNLKAGHAVPEDSWPALRMLQRIIANQDQ